jgi:hypothetical protein
MTMFANSIFQDVLNFIEDSNLNFVIHRTPFSANISLKRTFIKIYGDNQNEAASKEVRSKIDHREKAEKSTEMEDITTNTEKNLRKELSEKSKIMKELDDIKAELNLKSDENLVLANENVKLKESNKSKDKEIHTLKKEMKKVGEKQDSELVELKEFKENTIKKEKERKKGN